MIGLVDAVTPNQEGVRKMTAREIMISALSMATGCERPMVEYMLDQLPIPPIAHKEYSPAESKALLNGLWREREGIRAWLIEGRDELLARARNEPASMFEMAMADGLAADVQRGLASTPPRGPNRPPRRAEDPGDPAAAGRHNAARQSKRGS